MSITINSNFNPSDIAGSGVLIPAGTTRHDWAKAIKDAIISVGGDYFLEVTGSAPTPAALQAYAGNITPAGTSATSNGNPIHTTIYFKNDPAIAESPAKACMIRIIIGTWGLNACILDSKSANNPVTDSTLWLPVCALASSVETQTTLVLSNFIVNWAQGNSTYSASYQCCDFNNANDTSDTTSSSATTLDKEHKCYIWAGKEIIEGQDHEFLLIYNIRTANSRPTGVNFIFRTPEPADGHWTRSNRSSVHAISLMTAGNWSNSDINLWRNDIGSPGNSVPTPKNVNKGTWIQEYGFNPANLTLNSKELVQRITGRTTFGDTLNMLGYIPGLRHLRDGASIAQWATTTILGQKYVCIGKDGTHAWLLPSI